MFFFVKEKREDQSSFCFNYITSSSSSDFYDIRPCTTDHKKVIFTARGKTLKRSIGYYHIDVLIKYAVSHRNQFLGHLLFVIEIIFNIYLLHKQKKHLSMFVVSFVV